MWCTINRLMCSEQICGVRTRKRRRSRSGIAITSFNGKFRDDSLSLEWFRNRTDAKIVIESWRRHYNDVRPDSSLGNLTPAEFKRRCCTTRPAEAICQV